MVNRRTVLEFTAGHSHFLNSSALLSVGLWKLFKWHKVDEEIIADL